MDYPVGNSPIYYLVPVFGGAYLINHLPIALPDDKRQRDAALSLTPHLDLAWGGVLRNIIGKAVSQGYILTGDDDPVIQARAMLDQGGLSRLFAVHLRDYYCSNQGAWVRIRPNGYEYLNTLLVDNTDGSILYCAEDGEYENFSSEEVINLSNPAGCLADQFYAYIHPSEESPDEFSFIEGMTTNTIRAETSGESIEYQGKTIIPILPETSWKATAPLKHATLGRAKMELNNWKSRFANEVTASLFQNGVSFSFPVETKKNGVNRVESASDPILPPLVFNITLPPLTLPQLVVHLPIQEPSQINFEPAQVTVNVPTQPIPDIHIPAPVVNVQPAQVDVAVAAPQVSVEAPNITVEIPQAEEEIIDIKRNAEGYITQATRKRK